MEEGRPTGIKWEDLSGPQVTAYRGERATGVHVEHSGPEVVLVLGFGDRNIELFGYFEGDEFIKQSSRLC